MKAIKRYCIVFLMHITLAHSLVDGQPTLMWEHHFDFEEEYDKVFEFYVNSEGSCFVSGTSGGGEFGLNIISYMLDNAGDLSAFHAITGDVNELDEIFDYYVDKLNYSYLAGEFGAFDLEEQGFIQKLDPLNGLSWADTNANRATAVGVDNELNVFVTYVNDGGFSLVKYNEQGELLYSNFIDTVELGGLSTIPDFMIVAGDGSVYVAGHESKGNMNDYYFLLKFDSFGGAVSEVIYDPTSGQDYPRYLSVDTSGNLFLFGEADNQSGVALVKWDNNLNYLWDTIIKNLPLIEAAGLVTDHEGNALIMAFASINGIHTYQTRKFDPDGNILWLFSADTLEEQYFKGGSITVDDLGASYLVNSSVGLGSDPSDIILRKLDQDGNLVWKEQFTGLNDTFQIPRQLLLDSTGNIYITGEVFNPGTKRDIVTLKYSQLVGIDNLLPAAINLIVNPNPFSNQTAIKFSNSTSVKHLVLEVYDLTGKLLRSEEVSGQSSYRLLRQGLPEGMYLLQLRDENGWLGTAKIVIQ
jgi:hypothetical protein